MTVDVKVAFLKGEAKDVHFVLSSLASSSRSTSSRCCNWKLLGWFTG